MNLFIVTVVSLAAIAVVHGATFVIGRALGRYNVVDVAWGIGFIVVAAVSAVLGSGDPGRRILLLVLITLWAGRLSWHMVVKSAGKGKTPLSGATGWQLLGRSRAAQGVRDQGRQPGSSRCRCSCPRHWGRPQPSCDRSWLWAY